MRSYSQLPIRDPGFVRHLSVCWERGVSSHCSQYKDSYTEFGDA
jgi:hypothetical protein